MAGSKLTGAPDTAPAGGSSGERPAPPTTGSAIKPPKGEAAAALDSLDKLLEPVMSAVHRALMGKAVSYTDAKHMHEEQRADRAHLMALVREIAEGQQVAADTDHPVEGKYIGEKDIEHCYGDAMKKAGLFLLPNVVQTIGPDASGNVIVWVEYAIADHEGRLWSPAIRVAGMGNDRVATQRGGTGDKALPRALSAAYVEAVCRLMGVAIERHDAEQHDKAHEAVSGPSPRPSKGQGGEKPPALSLKDEDEFKANMLAKLDSFTELGPLHEFMGLAAVQAKMKRVGSRTRDVIEAKREKTLDRLERETRRRLDERERREAEEQEDRDADQGVERDRDTGTRGGYEVDDDIPF